MAVKKTQPRTVDIVKQPSLYTIMHSSDGAYLTARWLKRLLVDPFVAMLAFGALGHELEISFLLRLGFWESLIIIIALQILWPTTDINRLVIKKGGK